MLGHEGQDEVGRDRRHLIEPGFTELALDVVFLGKRKAANTLKSPFGRPVIFGACGQIGRFVQTWTSFTSPSSPPWINSTARRRPVSAVPWLPIWVQTLYLRAVSIIIRASNTVRVSGFWQYTCLPCRIAVMPARACAWSGVETTTPVSCFITSLSSNSLRKSKNVFAAGHFLAAPPRCLSASSMSHRAITSPNLPACSMSDRPLPPTPMPAKCRRSFDPCAFTTEAAGPVKK